MRYDPKKVLFVSRYCDGDSDTGYAYFAVRIGSSINSMLLLLTKGITFLCSYHLHHIVVAAVIASCAVKRASTSQCRDSGKVPAAHRWSF